MVIVMNKIQDEKTQLNKEQQSAVDRPINDFVKIVAGAGTGKTQIISKRFFKLVLDINEEYPKDFLERLLVITFTDKAANEMKGRILKELQENNIECYGQENSISTIHGFCSKFLRKHSIEAGLSPNFKLADEVQKQEIYNNIVEKIKHGETFSINNFDVVCQNLNIPQSVLDLSNLIKLAEIDTIENIFIGIFHIIKQIKSLGMSPAEFYEKSTQAIKTYSEKLMTLPFGMDSKEEYIVEWDNILKPFQDVSFEFCNDVLTSLADGKIVLDKHGKRKANEWTLAEDFVEDIEKATPLELSLSQIIAVIYALYQTYLEDADLLDFDDLINKTLFILENNEAIKKYYQKFFKHIIVDEFQDTSTAQLRLVLELLSYDMPNLTIVGDRKQSIYGFRYAKMENLDIIQNIIEKKYKQKYAPIKLIKNYRSNQEILDVVNNVTLNELDLDEELQAGIASKYEDISKKIKMTNLVNIKNSQDCKFKEAKYIASEIIEVKEKNNLQYKDFAILVKSHFQSDFIAEQLNSYGIPVIKKSNLNYFAKPVVVNISSILKLAQNIRNEVAFVRVLEIKFSQKEILNLKNEIDNVLYNLVSQNNDTNLNFVDKIIQIYDSQNFSKLAVSQEIKEYLITIFDTINAIQQNKKDLSIITIFNQLIDKINPYIAKNDIEKQNSVIETMIFEKIVVDYVKSETYTSLKSLNEYIAKIKEDKDFELPEITNAQIDAVQILTIHASKGLEFPYVFLPVFSNKSRPDASAISFELRYENEYDFGIIVDKINDKKTPKSKVFDIIYTAPRLKSEQKRLFYVALSRAKYFLNVINFEKYEGSSQVDYVCNLHDNFANYKNDIDADKINLEKKALPQIKFIEPPKSVCAPVIEVSTDKIEELSFSKINAFNHCPKMYLLKYVYGYPVLNNDNKGLQVGSVIHYLIADFYLNKQICSSDFIRQYLQRLGFEEKLIVEVLQIYKYFCECEYAQIEAKELISEYHFDFEYNDILFSGDVDLLLKNQDGSYDIVDFKTNKNIENSLFDYNKQLFIYKKSMESLGYNIKNVCLLNLKDSGSVKIVVSEEDLKIAQNALDMDIKNIQNLDFENVSKNIDYCKNCDYKYICNFS